MKKPVVAALLMLVFATSLFGGERNEVNSEGKGKGKTKKIAVLGSSVASGWVTSYKTKYDMKNGWAFRLERLLAPRGFEVINISIPGDSTASVLKRLPRDLFPLKADYVVIGLSMANEGLETGEKKEVMKAYEGGLTKIIQACREQGSVPVLGGCYANNEYSEEHFLAIKEMNLLTSQWNLPMINFLGGLDNGRGGFPENCTYDAGHPDNHGHEELFYSVVPSLFEAIETGIPLPKKMTGSGYVTIEKGDHPAPLRYVPEEVIHSFSFSFQCRTRSKGTLGSVQGESAGGVFEIDDRGKLIYRPTSGAILKTGTSISDGGWHRILLSHRYLLGQTSLFIDGIFRGKVAERIEPIQFVLGGSGRQGTSKERAKRDFREWLVYRSALTEDEARAMESGAFLSASLEVYAPLDGEKLTPGRAVRNLAQSLSTVIAYPSSSDLALGVIQAKLAAAGEARNEEPLFPEKKPVEVDPALYDAYTGEFEIAPNFMLTILKKDNRLFANPNNQGTTELFAEGKDKFFIKFPLAEITITFLRSEKGKTTGLIFKTGPQEMRAKKIR